MLKDKGVEVEVQETLTGELKTRELEDPKETMTIYTIVFNDYGNFADEWIKNAKKLKPERIIVVLGTNHNVKKREEDVCYIEYNSDVMGTLRNKALIEANTEWVLYFSVDDELLKYEIDNDYDAISLKFIDRATTGVETEKCSAHYKKEDLKRWYKQSVPGYIAHKRVINGKMPLYEDIEIPNYPFLFNLASLGAKAKDSEKICAVYKRRENSHGGIAIKEKRFVHYRRRIDEIANFYLEGGTVTKEEVK